MTGQDDDLGLERGLRDLLQGRDPGPAPYGLRDRVDRVPEEHPAVRRRDRLGRMAPLLATAAAVGVLVLAGTGLVAMPSPVGPGAPEAASPVPVATFDPTIVGPGILVAPAGDPGPLVALSVLLLGLATLLAHRRWKLVAGGGALALAGWAVIASQVPVTVTTFGSGVGLATTRAAAPPGSDQEVIYTTAAAGDPFSVAVFLRAESSAPVQLDGFIEPNRDDEDLRFPVWTAAWLDEQRGNGGHTGPGEPLAPFVIGPTGEAITLVGRAGTCAAGPDFVPPAPSQDGQSVGRDSVTVQVRTLGWPRTIEVPLGFQLSEPIGACES